MAMRDIAGRLLSRLRGTAAQNRYASIVRQKIEQQRAIGSTARQAEARQTSGERKTTADLMREFEAEIKRGYEQRIKSELLLPTGIPGQEGRLGPLNAQQIEAELGWQHVSSSNVEAIRWVGGNWGTQVRFKAKKSSPSSEYEYFGTFEDFLELKNASSKGKKIWAWRREQKPYHRIAGGRGKETIMYPWGQAATTGEPRRRNLEIPTRPANWWQRQGKTERDYRKLYYGK